MQPFLTSDLGPSTMKECENKRTDVKNRGRSLKIVETASSTNSTKNKKYSEDTSKHPDIFNRAKQIKRLLRSKHRKCISLLVICSIIFFQLSIFLNLLPTSLSPISEDIDEPAYFKDHFFNDDHKKKPRIDSRSRTNSVTYGFLHMQKTGGTTINGFLATHYERVCGNKGYSYDYHANNKMQLRNQQRQKEKEGTKRMLSTLDNKHPPRGFYRPPLNVKRKKPSQSVHMRSHYNLHTMEMIGFHNCDYIANEIGAEFWKDSLGDLHRPLELHIPCRDPVDLFLSMCNYRNVEFTCKSDFKEEVSKCLNNNNRFDMKLLTRPNIDLKCFESPSRIGDYFDYMGKRLQKKEVPDEYVHRDSNVSRNKPEECLWKQGIEYRQKLLENIMSRRVFFEYFQFCKECLKSDNNLLHLK